MSDNLLLFLIFALGAIGFFYTYNKNMRVSNSVTSSFPDKLKPLLKEEFADQSNLLTTSICATLANQWLNAIKTTTKKSELAEAINKMEKQTTKQKFKSSLLECYFSNLAELLPVNLAFLANDNASKMKLEQALHHALNQAMQDATDRY